MSTRFHAPAPHAPAAPRRLFSLPPWWACLPLAIAQAPCAAAAGEAAPQDHVRQLDAVRVEAARSGAEAASDAPAPRYGVDAEAIGRINVSSSEDALRYAPNLHVRKRFAGDNNALVSVRSTSSRQSARTLVYADGLLLSNLLGSDFGFAPRWSMVAPQDIERVDVLYGPYSARYPGNSLGATILIRTWMPERFSASGGVQFLDQDFREYGQHRHYTGQRYSAALGDRQGRWAWRLGLERLDNQGQPVSYYSALRSDVAAGATDAQVSGAVAYRDPFGRPAYLLGVNGEGATDTRSDQAALRATYDLAPEVQLALNVVDWKQTQDNRTGSWLRDADGRIVDAGAVAIDGMRYLLPANAFAPGHGESERRLYGLSLRSEHAFGWNYSLVASRFDTVRDDIRTASAAGGGPGTLARGDGSGWDNLDLQADYRAGAAAAHRISLGLHLDEYRLDSRVYASDDWRHGGPAVLNSAFAGNTRTQALFVQDAWDFAPDWQLLAGLRFERWRAFDGRRQASATRVDYASRNDDHWSPKLALQRALDGGWTARLSLARAWRMPTVGELFQGSISGNAIVNSDPGLKPEDAFSKDLTIERRGIGNTDLRMSLYEDDVRDTLFSQTDSTVFPTVTRIQNVDRVRTRGVELAMQARDAGVDGLDLSASLAWNHARTLQNRRNPASVGKRFYRIPEWRADAAASYRFAPWLRATLAGRYSGRQYNSLDESDVNPGTFGGASRYLVFDARVDVTLPRGWSLALGADNLFDERYYVYHPYPGRSWTAEAHWNY